MSTATISVTVTDALGASATGTTTADQGATGGIIPANRLTVWQPGVTYNGGIPNRTTIYKTLAPLGAGKDDAAQINAALNSCPANQVVQLTAGRFLINSAPIWLIKSNITLRGAGPGTPGAVPAMYANVLGTGGVGGTALVRPISANDYILSIGVDGDTTTGFNGKHINLTANAVKGTNTCNVASATGIVVGDIVTVEMIGTNDPDFWRGPRVTADGNGGSAWYYGLRPNSVGQTMEVTGVNGLTITFSTAFNLDYTTARTAQLTVWPVGSNGTTTPTKWSGVEGIYFTGGRNGSVSIARSAYCWFRNIEVDWGGGSLLGLSSCFRCEVRDSYIHGNVNPEPASGGYELDMTSYASDCLIENNIIWYGNKVNLCRRTGGGNVIAYNYMTDSFGGDYQDSPEAGVNAGHQFGSHMELIEGNYSHNFKGDTYWGSSPFITVFRNHLTAKRPSHAPLTLTDLHGRFAVDVQAGAFYQNFVGNVLGMQGQTLLSGQTGPVYEAWSAPLPDTNMVMWNFGAYQDINNNWVWDSTTINTQLRQGNWDWFTQKQRWHGIGGKGATDADVTHIIPNSMYLTSKPAFFGSNPWPWVDPATGTTYTLPAKARFDAGTPNG